VEYVEQFFALATGPTTSTRLLTNNAQATWPTSTTICGWHFVGTLGLQYASIPLYE